MAPKVEFAHNLFVACVIIATVLFGIALYYFRKAYKLDAQVKEEQNKQRIKKSKKLAKFKQKDTKINLDTSSTVISSVVCDDQRRNSKHDKILRQLQANEFNSIYNYNHLKKAWTKNIQPNNSNSSSVPVPVGGSRKEGSEGNRFELVW